MSKKEEDINQNNFNIIKSAEEKVISNKRFNPFKSHSESENNISSPKNKDIISLDTPNSSRDISIEEDNLNTSNERKKLKEDLTNKNNIQNNNSIIEGDDQIPQPKSTADLFDLAERNKKEENEVTWFNRDGRKEKDEYAEHNLKKLMEDHEKMSKLKKDVSLSISELESIQFNMYYVKVYSQENPILLKDKLRPRIKFDNLKHVPDVLSQNLKLLQYEYLTPVQRVIMPYIQYGKDIVCVTETGSGKTLAYLFSIIGQMLIQGVPENPYLNKNIISEDNNENKNKSFENIIAYPICLIIVPSRELASQISKDCKKLAQNTGIKTVEIIGGDKRLHQLIELSKGCDILVCTPMRLQVYLNSGKINLKLVKYLVLDEADKMLSYEFYEQLKDIFDKLPKKKFRQNLLFTATLNDDIKGIANYCLNNYYYFNSVKECPKTIKHMFYYCKGTEEKIEKLINFLKEGENKDKSILIFMNNKNGVDQMMEVLKSENISVCSIHGGKTQKDRNKAMRDFSLGYKKVLLATDLISRGMDFPYVYCVINFDVPESIEDYIHRIGRTGRLGQKGLALTFINRIDETNKENLINLLNNLGEEIPSWINEIEYQTRDNYIEIKKEAEYIKNYNTKRNKDNNDWNNKSNNNFNNNNQNNSNTNFRKRERNSNNNWNDNNNNNSNYESKRNNNNRNFNDRNNNRNNNRNNGRNNYRNNNFRNQDNRDIRNSNGNKNQNDNWGNNNQNDYLNNNNQNDNWGNNNQNDNWGNSNQNDNWSSNNQNDNWGNSNQNDNWGNNNQNDNWGNNNQNNNNETNNNNDNGWCSTNNNNNNFSKNYNNNNDNSNLPDNAYEELFIRGINYKSEEEDIKNTFSKYGEVILCKILKDKETNKSRGLGFVKFKEKYQAYNAMKDADNIECQGRKLKINYSNDKNRNNQSNNKNNFDNNRNRNFSKRNFDNRNKNDNFNNKKEDDNDGWNERNNERERSREKENNNNNADVDDIDGW